MSETLVKYIKNANLGSREVKNNILKYLYSSNINLNLKYEIITSEKDLDNIRDNDYIICPRFGGTRSWILFFQIDNNYYAVNFPKHSQRKKEDLYIHPIEMSVCKQFYRGTIMEGIFFRIDEKKYLVVDEVYMLGGQNQLLKPKDDRLNYLKKYFQKYTNINENYYMYVSQYFTPSKSSLKELYEKIKSDPKIQDIIFYPKIYGRKIYNYTIIDSDLVDNVIKLAQFYMQKTASPDVFNLLAPNTKNKIDIAYIPDAQTSKMCRQWFKDNKAKELFVKCQMDMEKKKWIPIELVEQELENDEHNSSDDEDTETSGTEDN
ncbi:putative mRNA capping enzyme [Tupanvirus soda lake]|uniref:mRNA capping enzyme n=2 Tax=Tupanvirus TaxID=2094720 RepID=A0AC62ABR8_9VIRU|nr:putative mRNA capping enzyme [Tupanvirus soda lake]QKU35048.1 putative mRNA capping enzyme [Tupanvirus soda lake]